MSAYDQLMRAANRYATARRLWESRDRLAAELEHYLAVYREVNERDPFLLAECIEAVKEASE